MSTVANQLLLGSPTRRERRQQPTPAIASPPPPQGYWYSDDGDSIQLSWLIAADRPLKQLVHLKKPFISHPQYFLGITCEDNRLDLDVVRLSEIVSAMKGEVAEFGRFSFLLQTP